MMLRDLQAAFRAAILADDDEALLPLVHGRGLSPRQRLQVYRNNTFISLADALAANFPVVHRLVGEAFFRAAARAYIREQPPCRPCLAEYGEGFAAFLARFPPARALPYLPDVARLERTVAACEQASHSPALAPTELAAVPEARRAALRLRLHEACRLFESPFPIDRIWLANQPDRDGAEVIDLDAGGCRLLVQRGGEGTLLHALAPAEFAFLGGLAAGATLAEAYDRAAARCGPFDLAGLLHRLLRFGCLGCILTAPAEA